MISVTVILAQQGQNCTQSSAALNCKVENLRSPRSASRFVFLLLHQPVNERVFFFFLLTKANMQLFFVTNIFAVNHRWSSKTVNWNLKVQTCLGPMHQLRTC